MAWLKDTSRKIYFAVVMDAKTGEILAYSQRPTFNPETGKDFW